jgi:hypothetical protein
LYLSGATSPNRCASCSQGRGTLHPGVCRHGPPCSDHHTLRASVRRHRCSLGSARLLGDRASIALSETKGAGVAQRIRDARTPSSVGSGPFAIARPRSRSMGASGRTQVAFLPALGGEAGQRPPSSTYSLSGLSLVIARLCFLTVPSLNWISSATAAEDAYWPAHRGPHPAAPVVGPVAAGQGGWMDEAKYSCRTWPNSDADDTHGPSPGPPCPHRPDPTGPAPAGRAEDPKRCRAGRGRDRRIGFGPAGRIDSGRGPRGPGPSRPSPAGFHPSSVVRCPLSVVGPSVDRQVNPCEMTCVAACTYPGREMCARNLRNSGNSFSQ